MKQTAIPSLYLNGENKDTISSNQNTIVKENQSTNIVIKYSESVPVNKALNIVESHTETEKDDELSERISPSPISPSEPEKKRKKHLYDVRWEEISTSSVQAKIYWEVAIKKIKRQKLILRTLRQKIKRLEKQKLFLQSLVKHKEITDA